jgi:hypothetical protein
VLLPALFYLVFFFFFLVRGSSFRTGCARTAILPISASRVAGITGASRPAQFRAFVLLLGSEVERCKKDYRSDSALNASGLDDSDMPSAPPSTEKSG